MICNNCKRTIDDDERVCPYCGQIVRYDKDVFDIDVVHRLLKEEEKYKNRLNEINEKCNQVRVNLENSLDSFLKKRKKFEDKLIENEKTYKLRKMNDSLYRSILYDPTEIWIKKLDEKDCAKLMELKNNLNSQLASDNIFKDELRKYVKFSYLYKEIIPIHERVTELLQRFDIEGYQEMINNVNSIQSKLKWNFTFGKKKESILSSYGKLINYINYEFLTEMDNLIEDFEKIDFNIRINVLKKLEQEPKELYGNLYKAEESEIYESNFGYNIPDVSEFKNEFKVLSAHYPKSTDSLVTNLKSTIRLIVQEQVKKELNKVSIEEINKISKEGKIRVSSLKNSGYSTLADLAYIPSYALERVNGVGSGSAIDIVATMENLVKNIDKEIKIKINLDNRDQNYDQVVLLVNKYLKYQDFFKELETFENKYKVKNLNKIEFYILDLESVTNKYWAFGYDKNHEKIEHATVQLEKLIPEFLKDQEHILRLNEELKEITVEDSWKAFKENPVLFNGTLEKIIPNRFGSLEKQIDLPEQLIKAIELEKTPLDGLKCQLRSYQEWGVKYTLHQKKVLIGDEMGLGKTIQAIATMTVLHNRGYNHFLVICPASVLSNWCREVHKFSDLKVVRIHGNDKETYLNHWIKFGGVGVTTYETTKFFDLKKPFDFLVVDEAHFIKNPNAQRSRNVKRLSTHTDRIMFLTGTALENRIEEMIELIRYLRPDIAGKLPEISHIGEARKFKETISPVYFRRKREDVLQELPDLIENNDWCTMTSYEEKAYENAILERNFMKSRRVSWNFDDLKYSSKCKRLLEIIDEAKEENRKIIVFSYFLKTIEKIKKVIGTQCFGPINGSVSPKKRQDVIDLFESSSDGSVLLAQIEAAGTGLNIQAASVVVICEPQFKPSIENQAIARAYRMGQTRNVLVHRLLCEDSVDEKITEVLNKKQELFDKYADESVAAKETSDKKLMTNILEEEFKRIAKKNKIL